MSIWWLIPAFVGLVGILMLVGGVAKVFKAKLGSGLMRVLFGGLTLAGAMIVGLIGLNLQTYAQLSKERLAGQVVLKKVGDHNYTASIDLADDGKLRGCIVDLRRNTGGKVEPMLASIGPLAGNGKRRQLSDSEAMRYTVAEVLGDWPAGPR